MGVYVCFGVGVRYMFGGIKVWLGVRVCLGVSVGSLKGVGNNLGL